MYMPIQSHIGVSQRIENEENRQRLNPLISEQCKETDETNSCILRTAVERSGEENILSY